MSRMHFPWKRQICRSALAPHFRFGIWFGLELEQTVPASRISFPEGMAAMATANGKGTWAWALAQDGRWPKLWKWERETAGHFRPPHPFHQSNGGVS